MTIEHHSLPDDTVEKGIKEDIVIKFPEGQSLAIFGVIHTPEYFKANEQKIRQLVASASFVGVEDDSVLLYPKGNDPSGFYKPVIGVAWDYKKLVVCCDPASESYVANWIDVLSGMTGAFAVAAYTQPALQELFSKPISRRAFLKIMPVVIGATVFEASTLGRTVSELFMEKPSEGVIHHPQIIDSLSFLQFRNATILLGYETLSRFNILESNRGIQFIGDGHNPDFRGMTTNGNYNRDITLNVFKDNAYKFAISPTARVWAPDENSKSYHLVVREPITV